MIRGQDITGLRFGKLVARTCIRRDGLQYWECDCDCGCKKTVARRELINGDTKSCGCERPGLSRTGAGRSWSAMMTRCYNQNTPQYVMYGGRGIVVCEFLRATPVNLIALLGHRSLELSIDRINNYGNYSCGACAECLSKGWPMNVRWATRHEQNRNQRDLRYIEIDGVSRCVGEWAEIKGIGYRTLMARVLRGVTGDALFSKPKDMNKQITIEGVTRPAKEWSAMHGIKHDTFLGRIEAGKTGLELIKPVISRGSVK